MPKQNRRPGIIKLVTIRGVELKLHISLIFLMLYAILVGALQFPGVVHQAGLNIEDMRVGPLLSGFIFALGLLLSVAIHEYGHVFVAQAQGVPVKGVTLMMLGGVSEIGSYADEPGQKAYAELKLALIGPIVSLALGVALLGLHRLTLSPEIDLFTYWLGSANLVLGIFNLIPAFPLDGGRVLRSFLAARNGNLKGTRIAVKVSQIFAWLLGILGLLGFNFILVLIAFFIYSAAQSELMVLMARGILKGLQVKEAMNRIHTLREEQSLMDAASEMLNTRHRIIPVQTSSGEGALISLEWIRNVQREQWSKIPIKQLMQKVPKVLDATDPISQVMGEVMAAPLRTLPVKENGEIVGLLSFSDLTEIIQLKTLEKSPYEEDRAA